MEETLAVWNKKTASCLQMWPRAQANFKFQVGHCRECAAVWGGAGSGWPPRPRPINLNLNTRIIMLAWRSAGGLSVTLACGGSRGRKNVHSAH
jgi:hypothetical protein